MQRHAQNFAWTRSKPSGVETLVELFDDLSHCCVIQCLTNNFFDALSLLYAPILCKAGPEGSYTKLHKHPFLRLSSGRRNFGADRLNILLIQSHQHFQEGSLVTCRQAANTWLELHFLGGKACSFWGHYISVNSACAERT